VRVATAVSEIARNAFRYAGGGDVDFSLEGESAPQLLLIRVTDHGPGIADLNLILNGRYRSSTGMGMGIVGARRLVDQFDIRSTHRRGTEVVLKKLLPRGAPVMSPPDIARLAGELTSRVPTTPYEEMQQQNHELVRALDEVRERQEELMRVNRELEDTNRGVVALYAELDEKAEHLRRADEMKSRFLSNMSHEFRTPLNSIRAPTRLLLDHVDGPLTAEQEKQLNFIRKAAEDLTQLVDDLLDLAKIEAGKIEVRPVEFTVQNLFSALRGMLRPLLLTESVSLRFDDASAIPALLTDEAKVSQILRNFISNALKFTERGEVRVSADYDAHSGMVKFSVADTGIGIAPGDQERIFEEFSQVQNPLQARVKGTGLGLPLCRRLATLLGGSIGVSSERGIGSTFTATLPLRYEPQRADPATEAPVVLDPQKTPILVVEDEPETRLFYEKILRETPYQVVPASNLREARLAMERLRPGAIVLDILLRGEDSWPWLSHIKNDPATRGIPLLVASAVEDERKAYALGADGYLRKPVERDMLLTELARCAAPRILVIDDDPASRYAIKKILSVAQYAVVDAVDGGTGLELARTAHPQLVVLDLSLPDMKGEEVLHRLAQDAATRAVPVVIATSRDLSHAERQVLQQHASAVLSKRDLTSDLLPAVASALMRGAAVPQS
jgi:signal transduction histidine kinase/DNA-binding response OmpR family regulator